MISYFFLFGNKNYLDTEQLMNYKMRTVEGKRIFAIIGLTSICLVFALLFMLYAFDRDETVLNDTSSTNFGETFIFKELETTKIDQNVQKRHVPDESIYKSNTVKFDRFKRLKRQLALNPVYYSEQPSVENSRHKRLSEKLKEVQMKFELCRNSNPVPNDCEAFHREMIEVHEALEHEIQMSKFGRYSDQSYVAVEQPNLENYGKFSEIPEFPGDTMQEFNREDKVLQIANEFSPFPKFHEELDNRHFNSWNVKEPSQNAPEFLVPSPPARTIPPSFGSVRDNEKITPLKPQNFGKKFESIINNILMKIQFFLSRCIQIQAFQFCGFAIKLINKVYTQINNQLKLAFYPNQLSVDPLQILFSHIIRIQIFNPIFNQCNNNNNNNYRNSNHNKHSLV